MGYVLRNRFNQGTQPVYGGGLRFSNTVQVPSTPRAPMSQQPIERMESLPAPRKAGSQAPVMAQNFQEASYKSPGTDYGQQFAPEDAPMQNVGGVPISLSDWAMRNAVVLPGAEKFNQKPRETQSYAKGGVIPEHVIGRGMETGLPYEFGEMGPETVVPNGPIQQDTSDLDEQLAAELQRVLGRRVIVRPNRPMKVRNTAVPESYTQGNQSRATNAPVIQVSTDDVMKLARDPRFAPLVGRLIEAEKRGGLQVTNRDGSPYGPQSTYGQPGQQAGSGFSQPSPTPTPDQGFEQTSPDMGFEQTVVPGSPTPSDSPLPPESPTPPDSPTPPETQQPVGTPFLTPGAMTPSAPQPGAQSPDVTAEAAGSLYPITASELKTPSVAGFAGGGKLGYPEVTPIEQYWQEPSQTPSNLDPSLGIQFDPGVANFTQDASAPMPDASWTFDDIVGDTTFDQGTYDPVAVVAPDEEPRQYSGGSNFLS